MMRSGFFGSGIPGSGFIVPLSAGGGPEGPTGQGTLLGYSDNGESATQPAPLTFEFVETAALPDAQSGGISFDFAYGDGGGASVAKFWLGSSDPLSDYTFVDASGASSESEMVTLLAGAIDAALLGLYSGTDGRTLTVGLSSTGSSAMLGCTVGNNASNVIQGGGGNGNDGVDPTGHVNEVELIAAHEVSSLHVEEVTFEAGPEGFDLPDDTGWEVGWYDEFGAWQQVAFGGDLSSGQFGELTPLSNVDLEFGRPLLARYTGTPPTHTGAGQQMVTVSALATLS